jgi:preprotein translocase subunit YajC
MNMSLLSIMLVAGTGTGFGNIQPILMMVLIFVVFYFFMIRPQTKRQKEIKKQREAMQPGDKVVTSGGIYGKVKEIKETTVIVEIADNVRIKVDKNSVFASADDAQTEVK